MTFLIETLPDIVLGLISAFIIYYIAWAFLAQPGGTDA